MKTSIPKTSLLIGATVLASAVQAAPQTPKDAYDIDMTCAAVAAAARTRKATTADPVDPATSTMELYDRRAQASGEKAGFSPEKVAHDVDALRQNIVRRMNASDPARAQAEKSDNAAMLKSCAVLPVFELENRLTPGRS